MMSTFCVLHEPSTLRVPSTAGRMSWSSGSVTPSLKKGLAVWWHSEQPSRAASKVPGDRRSASNSLRRSAAPSSDLRWSTFAGLDSDRTVPWTCTGKQYTSYGILKLGPGRAGQAGGRVVQGSSVPRREAHHVPLLQEARHELAGEVAGGAGDANHLGCGGSSCGGHSKDKECGRLGSRLELCLTLSRARQIGCGRVRPRASGVPCASGAARKHGICWLRGASSARSLASRGALTPTRWCRGAWRWYRRRHG